MEISEKREGAMLVLTPIGRLDNETSPAFQARLLEAVAIDSARVLLDFSALEYISSAGLRALMMAARKSKAAGGRLAIAVLTPMVKEIFTISRFALVVPVFDTVAQAALALS